MVDVVVVDEAGEGRAGWAVIGPGLAEDRVVMGRVVTAV
jgi:hypothetical protein